MRWTVPSRFRWQATALFGAVVLIGFVVTRLFNLSGLEQPRTVGDYFDNPPAWPGEAWTRNGVSVSSDVLVASAGPSHCQMQAMTFLTIGWPPGTVATSAAQAREYIRTPIGTPPAPNLRGTWARNAPLPPDAADTGYRYGVLKLLIAPSDGDRYVYLVAPADSERWPRSDPMTLCS
jgi:hypothetical protein